MRRQVLLLGSGARWARLLPGQRLDVSGRLGQPRDGDDVAAVFVVRGPPRLVGEPGLAQRVAGELRDGLRSAVADLPPDERGLVPGLVVGDTSRLPEDLVDDFRTAGLTHLVAVSGANVAIVLGFVLFVGRWAGVRGAGLPTLGALAILGFVVLARPQPSVLRAAVMGLVAVAALASGRRRSSLPALAAAVLLLVLADPWLARSYGFALSVLATGGLLLLAPPWTDRLSGRIPRPLAAAIAVPAAAQVACAPVVAMLSSQVSLVAIPANLLVAPAVAPATILGVLAAVIAPVSTAGAGLLGRLAGLPAWWIVTVAEHAARFPQAALRWPDGAGGALLLLGSFLLVVLGGPWLLRRRRVLALVAAGAVGAVVPIAADPRWPPADWLFVACDVGQGDALVLNAGAGSGEPWPRGEPPRLGAAVVVDAGPDPAAVDRCLRDLGVRRVPLVLLTHLHADHVEGLPGVLRGRDVAQLEIGPLTEPPEEFDRVAGWARSAGLELTHAQLDEQRAIGGLAWRVVWPARVIRGEGSIPNNASVVLLVQRSGVRLLLTGDVEPAAQRALLARIQGLAPVDVLKVPHHGSEYQAPELVLATRPRVAVVSVGVDNEYGHPAPATIRAIERSGAGLLRTDLDGDVAVAGSRDRLRVVRRDR
jgi:competence protein ComEC